MNRNFLVSSYGIKAIFIPFGLEYLQIQTIYTAEYRWKKTVSEFIYPIYDIFLLQ